MKRGMTGALASMVSVAALTGAGGAAQAQTAAPVAASATEAAAETAVSTATDGRTTYPVGYFTQFAPSTALDVVQRIPGFSLDTGDQDVRGFGGAAGNLVIDGERPSAKSDSLATILSRIPASRVLRVEVGSGDLFGSEYIGRPQVANLILTDGGGLAGTIEASIARDYTGSLTPQGTVSALLRRGPSTFNASIGYENQDYLEEGTDTVRALPGRAITEFRVKENDIRDQEWFATASWAFDGGPNKSANLNGRYERNRFTLRQTNEVFPTGGVIRDDRLSQLFTNDQFEIGGDVTRPLLGGGVKLIGLYRSISSDNRDDVFLRVDSDVIGGFVQTVANKRDEAVARVVWSHGDIGGWALETGFEGAFNRLDSNVDLFGVAAGGALLPIDLPVDDAVVSEYRGESFFNAGRSLTPKLRIDLGLTYEQSRLTVSGDAQAERTLRFLKPKVSLDWRPGGGWRVQSSLTRSVAQLDFNDFVGAAELANDRVDGGNPDLLPQREWEYRLSVERPVLGDGRLQAQVGYDHVSLLQDRVPIAGGGDAPGNLGTGRRYFVSGTVDLPLTALGIRGGRLTASGTWVDTSVRDPYTGVDRFFSGNSRWFGEAGFRQDLGTFAWGFNYFGQPRQRVFRGSEIDSFDGDEPFVTAFAEYRATPKTTVTLSGENLFDVAGTRNRLFFIPDRTAAEPSFVEDRRRNRHVTFTLSLKHSFG
jgi:hypothetical protein